MIRQGEIWLMPIPFPDQTGLKLRPALVISGPEQLQRDQDALVMGITSRHDPPQPRLRLDNTVLADGTLHRPSMLMCGRVFTVNRSLFRICIGTVQPDFLEQAFRALDSALGRA